MTALEEIYFLKAERNILRYKFLYFGYFNRDGYLLVPVFCAVSQNYYQTGFKCVGYYKFAEMLI